MAQDSELAEVLEPGIYTTLLVREDLSTTIVVVTAGENGAKITLPLTRDQAVELALNMADLARQARICGIDKDYARQLFDEGRASH